MSFEGFVDWDSNGVLAAGGESDGAHHVRLLERNEGLLSERAANAQLS